MTFISQHMKIIKNMKFIYIFLLFVVRFLLFNIVFHWVHIPHFVADGHWVISSFWLLFIHSCWFISRSGMARS